MDALLALGGDASQAPADALLLTADRSVVPMRDIVVQGEVAKRPRLFIRTPCRRWRRAKLEVEVTRGSLSEGCIRRANRLLLHTVIHVGTDVLWTVAAPFQAVSHPEPCRARPLGRSSCPQDNRVSVVDNNYAGMAPERSARVY